MFLLSCYGFRADFAEASLRLQQAFNLVEAESLLGQSWLMDRASSFGPRVCKDLGVFRLEVLDMT